MLKSCPLSIKKDAGQELAKPVSRGKTMSELGTSHLSMKHAFQYEKDRLILTILLVSCKSL